VLSALPGLGLVALLIRHDAGLGGLVVAGLVAVPFAVLTWMFCYAMLLAAATRLAGRRLRPGVFPSDGGMAFAAWLTTALTEAARGALFPLYASLATPGWLRLLGARVGRNVEASTVHLLPSLTSIGDLSFLADDTLVAPYELRGGWMRLGRSHVGHRAFVGNSGIVGPGRSVGDGGLIGVLSQTPVGAEPGSSWLGQPPMPVPRQVRTGDSARTYAPPRRLVLARGLVESCRVFPLMLSAALGDLVIGALDQTYLKLGLLATAAVSGLVLFAAGVVACLLASLIKWLLVGRSKPAEHPLWSSWVWRNELADVAIEELAVPWLAGAAMGTPLLNAWLRTLGARIGPGAWIETYWLPEPDLITIGAGASVNRGVVVQTHLFHDRIMQLDRTTLEAGATLGPHSIVLPAATVGRHALVGPASLVMRGESVPEGTSWSGNPVAPMEVKARFVARRPGRRVTSDRQAKPGWKVKAQTVK
jgi:non-ribosomal peptide synthetase-like protein